MTTTRDDPSVRPATVVVRTATSEEQRAALEKALERGTMSKLQREAAETAIALIDGGSRVDRRILELEAMLDRVVGHDGPAADGLPPEPGWASGYVALLERDREQDRPRIALLQAELDEKKALLEEEQVARAGWAERALKAERDRDARAADAEQMRERVGDLQRELGRAGVGVQKQTLMAQRDDALRIVARLRAELDQAKLQRDTTARVALRLVAKRTEQFDALLRFSARFIEPLRSAAQELLDALEPAMPTVDECARAQRAETALRAVLAQMGR